jgi:Zn finger protein HypA/HybF involved in hydrogenase expression
MSQDGAKFSIEGKIVDPLTSTKIDNEVLNGLSIGIKGARIDESKEALKRAPNGIIMGGRIVEVSLVDLPANPSAVLELVKTVGDVTVKTDALGDLDEVEKKGDPDCLTCKGKGTIKDGHVDCPDCVQGKAAGYKPTPYKKDPDETVQCPKCDRFNDTDAHFCDQCGFKLDGATDVEVKTVEGDVEKKLVSTKEQNDLPDSDFAYIEPGGKKDDDGMTVPRSLRHFPIQDAAHVRNALSRAPQSPFGSKAMPKILAAAKKFDIKVSKSLDAVLTKAADEDMKHDPAQLGEIRTLLVSSINAELSELESGSDDEMSDLYQLLNALGIFLSWWEDEAAEGETEPPFPENDGDDTMAYIAMGISPDLVKRVSAPEATEEDKTEFKSELLKSLVPEGIATKAELEELREVNKGLKAALEDVREMAAPSQVARRATFDQQNKSAEADELEQKAVQYRNTALVQTDKAAMAQYVEAADTLMKRVAELRQPN